MPVVICWANEKRIPILDRSHHSLSSTLLEFTFIYASCSPFGANFTTASEIVTPAIEIRINTSNHTHTNNHKITSNPWYTVEMSIMLVFSKKRCNNESLWGRGQSKPSLMRSRYTTPMPVHILHSLHLFPIPQHIQAGPPPTMSTHTHTPSIIPSHFSLQYCVNSGESGVDSTKQ